MKVKQTISINQEVLKAIKHKAVDLGKGLSELVERAIQRYLANGK